MLTPLKENAAKRVLIYRLGSLGDTLIALPSLHLIARAFPTADRRMLTSFPPAMKAPPSSAILEHTNLVHGFFRYTYGTRNLTELIALWWKLLQWRPQVLIYLSGNRGLASAKRDAFFFRLCGIRRLIGVPLNEDMLTSRQQAQPNGEVTQEAEGSRLARNLAELGDAQIDQASSWDLHLTPSEHRRAAQCLLPLGNRPLIAVSTGTKMQSKDWGVANWRSLLAHLAASYPDYALALCGAADEFQASETAAAGWREVSDSPTLNLCGVLAPRESAAVFARAVLFVGHDSGPMHLAAAVQTACVAIFSARNIPRVWFPYGDQHRVLYHHVDCQGCGLETCIVQKKKCITSITPDEVMAQIRTVIAASPPFRANRF